MNSSTIHKFYGRGELPRQFTFPYCYTPHPLVLQATDILKEEISGHPEWQEEISRGKMFGVLVCQSADHQRHASPSGSEGTELCFLAAFSGTLGGMTRQPFFVDPVYDLMEPGSYFKKEEAYISTISDSKPEEAKTRSVALQRWLFSQYHFLNARGETAGIGTLFGDALPPSGTGDCCAPKLLQAAYRLHLRPLCMGEFWMGASPRGEIRREGTFYPACSGKCKPLLRHMLVGLDVEPNPLLKSIAQPITILYEDASIVVIEKPSGMLAVPGKDALPNVQEMIREKYPHAQGPLIVQRLDMDTSGIMVLALNDDAYHHLQNQFVKHLVTKCYSAILEREMPVGTSGRIDLPICPDITDRPRQMVHEKYGRRSITEYLVVDNVPLPYTFSCVRPSVRPHALVHLWPHTGRTHQLRVHCAHQLGLGNPICGDRLYGTEGKRLLLHAAELTFTHPVTGETMHFVSELKV